MVGRVGTMSQQNTTKKGTWDMEQTEYNGYHYQRNNANKWVKEQYAKYVSMLITTIGWNENNTT